MALAIPASLLGLMVSGDVSGETIYTDRHGRKVHYPKAPPKEPPTDLQVAHRARFRLAQTEWMQQDYQVKKDLERLVICASLCLTGQNLWIHVAMQHTGQMLSTLMRQHQITVPQPTPV